ncbi:hypothetical protein IWQ62_003037 [Dispira parvispora]|uniref:Ribosomal protein S21 n=1 Tax=Dispira parvispora TaxID=1520584 RepID=A0A9W8ASL0_9FUNG|nr:hypothetical protein IWQ62_003037 [Dispira parvispora]
MSSFLSTSLQSVFRSARSNAVPRLGSTQITTPWSYAAAQRWFSHSRIQQRSPLHQNFPPVAEDGIDGIFRSTAQVSSGRSIVVTSSNPNPAYFRLNTILNYDNVRRELRLKRRYEKPTKKRLRLKVERASKRFNALVQEKMALVDKMRRL